jgi:hypothetical protein
LGPAIVNSDRYNFALFKEEEFDDQVVPCLDELMLALYPGSRLGKRRFLVSDQANVGVLVVGDMRLQRMFT